MASSTPFYLDRPLVIAHRGARDSAPENTMAAFRAALEQGADGIELDVMRCRSGEIMIMHDDTVDRTTDGSGRVSNLSWDELGELDAGDWFGDAFEHEPIPLLSEVLGKLGGELRINIEIKAGARGQQTVEQDVAAMVVSQGLADSVIISSFDPRCLFRMRRCAPNLALGLLYSSHMPLLLRTGAVRHFLRPAALHPQLDQVTERYVRRARREGYRINVWTVNETQDFERMIAQEVDSIITDRPSTLHQLLAQQ